MELTVVSIKAESHSAMNTMIKVSLKIKLETLTKINKSIPYLYADDTPIKG